jgi:hypothetical protein
VRELCRLYVKAQQDYVKADHDGDGVLEYAQRFLSSEGTQDGLYWPANGIVAREPLRTVGLPREDAGLYTAGKSRAAVHGLFLSHSRPSG